MSRRPRATSPSRPIVATLLAVAFSVAATPRVAAAQELRARLEVEAREQLSEDVQRELEAADAQRGLAGDLYIAAGVILGVGLGGLVAAAIGTSQCGSDCVPWYALIGAGAGTAAIGLGFFIAAATLADAADERRRELMREHLAGSWSIGPLPGGAFASWRLAF